MKTTKTKNLWIVPIYGIIYLIMFFILENSSLEYQVIYSPLDGKIPFCEYFVVPYFLWFFYMAAVVLYFMFWNESCKEYQKLISMLGTGMTIFLIISFVLPNCHYLRPILPEHGNIFLEAVRFLYIIDTSTNLIPSIHVYNTLACWIAVKENTRCRKYRFIMIANNLLTVLIVLSTMFLKQHSVIDVTVAFISFVISYWIFYRFIPAHQEQFDEICNRSQIKTVPNMLSLLRLFLALLFWGVGNSLDFIGKQPIMLGMLIVAGITDFLDGWIARKCNMASEFGKVLDPVANKAIQGVLLLYLVGKYPLIQMMIVLFLIKELSIFIVGSKIMIMTGKHEDAKWYGKVSTIIFYVVMAVLIAVPKIPLEIANGMLSVCSVFLAVSFIKCINDYLSEYKAIRGDIRWMV